MNKKSSIILILILGLTIKIISLLYKIISTRLLGLEGMKIIAILSPILGLSLTLSSFQTGVVTNQNIASNIKSGKTKIRIILLSSLKITLTSSTIISILLLLSFPLYSLIYDDKTLYYLIILFIPLIFICNISSLIKAYLEAYNNFNYIYITNTIEMILKIILMIVVLSIFKNYSIKTKIFFIYIGIILSEISSLIILLKKLKRHINKDSLKTKTNKYELKVLKQAFPLTIDSLISATSSYIIPFIYYFALNKINISTNTGITYYTLVSNYAIPLLVCGQFPIMTIAKLNFPKFSKEIDDNKKCSNYFEKAFILSLFISTIVLILCIVYPYDTLNLLYGDTSSYKIVIYLAPIYFFLYFDPLFIMILQSRNKEKLLLYTTIICQILNIILVYFLTKNLLFNTSGYIIAISITSLIKFIILSITSIKIIRYKPSKKMLIFITICLIFFILNYNNPYYIFYIISTIVFFLLYLLLFYLFYKNI